MGATVVLLFEVKIWWGVGAVRGRQNGVVLRSITLRMPNGFSLSPVADTIRPACSRSTPPLSV